MRKLDLKGERFGKLIVLSEQGINNNGSVLWHVRCVCGKQSIVIGSNMKKGTTRSCGCLKGENNVKHGECRGRKESPEHYVWKTMIQRCYRKKNSNYKHYGGRGIKVCRGWIKDFDNFLKDMGRRPNKNYQIERINNDGNYEPANCKWATAKEQANNRRTTHFITHKGETKTISTWAKILNMKHDTLYSRFKKGWETERIFSQPIKGRI